MTETNLLEAKKLQKHYQITAGAWEKPRVLKALAGASFTLSPGKTLAVVGESGCGKSTMARLVTMIEQPTSGELSIDGKDVVKASQRELDALRPHVQIVFQNPYGSLNPRHRIRSTLSEPLKVNSNLSAREINEKVMEMMSFVGLRPEFADRYPHMFSGGQRQRIAVARALILNPRILVLDEPVSALDLSIQAQILNLITEIQDRLGLAYLFISHDLSVVKFIADEIIVMYLGQVVEQGQASEIFKNPRHPYTLSLLSATPVADPLRKKERIVLQGEIPSPINPPSGCPFHPRCRHASDRCKKEIPQLSGPADHQVNCFHPQG